MFSALDSLPEGVFAGLPMCLWTTDIDLFFTSVIAGPGFEHQFSLSRAVVSRGARRGYDLRYPQHPDVSAHLRARSGETVTWQMGWSSPTRACAAPLYGAQGDIVGVVGAAVDLSEVAEEERRRESAEQLLYAVLEQEHCAASILDQDNRVVFANQVFLDAVGKSPQEVLGSREQALLNDAVDGPVDSSQWVSKRGDRRFRSRRFSLSGPDGREFTLHTAVDVSEAIRLREELSRRQEWYGAFIDGAEKPVAIVDTHQRIEAANAEFGRMLGLQPDRLVGDSLQQWINPCWQDSFDTLWGSLTSGDLVDASRDIFFTNHSGQMMLAKVKVRSVENSGGLVATVWEVSSWGDPAAEVATRQSNLELSDIDGRLLERLAVGESNAEIAESLCMSRQGLDYRLKVLRQRLRAGSRGALVARAYAEGLFCVGEWPPRVRDNEQ